MLQGETQGHKWSQQHQDCSNHTTGLPKCLPCAWPLPLIPWETFADSAPQAAPTRTHCLREISSCLLRSSSLGSWVSIVYDSDLSVSLGGKSTGASVQLDTSYFGTDPFCRGSHPNYQGTLKVLLGSVQPPLYLCS